MKINNIQQNFNAQNKKQSKQTGASPSFTALKINDIMPYQKTFKWMKNQEWLKGEAGGILITALGTGIVAPIVMGTNPLVRAPKGATEDEKKEVMNKKWYTAMRQPISAALAILFQLGALGPIDKVLDKLFNLPENAKWFDTHLDQSLINTKSFRKGLAKEQFKAEGRKKAPLYEIFTKGWKTTMKARNEYNEAFNDLVDDIADKQVQKVADDLRKTGDINFSTKKLDSKTLAELVNDRIDDYIEDAQTLKYKNEDLARYTEKAKLIMNNKDELRDLISSLPEDSKEIETVLRRYEETASADMRKLIQDLLDRPDDLVGSRAKRTLTRIQKITDACHGNYTVDNYLDAMAQRNAELDRIITKLSLKKIENPTYLTPKSTVLNTIKDVIEICRFNDNDELLKPILRNTVTFDSNVENLTKKVYKDIAKGFKELVEHEYKAVNQITKVAIGVGLTLPLTCTALNWVYPRLMDLLFPNLSGHKQAEKPEEEVK